MMPLVSRRSKVHGEAGFTLIEVLVAMLVLVLIVGAASSLYAHAEVSSAGTVATAQLVGVADQQIELVRTEAKTEGFDALAMSAAPAHSSATPLLSDGTVAIQSNPDYFVSTGTGCGAGSIGYEIEENWDNSLGGAPTGINSWSGCTDTTSPTFVAEPLEVISTGLVGSSTSGTCGTTVEMVCTQQIGSNGPTVTVYTFVTDTYVGCLNNTTYPSSCPTVSSGGAISGCTWPTATTLSTTCADARRVIVAVVPPSTGSFKLGQATPVYESTIFAAATPSNAQGGTDGLTLGLQLG